MARIVVCGYMLRHPVAGNVLAFFQYVLGLARLGHDVVYLEESGWPYSAYNPRTRHWDDHPEAGLEIVADLLRTWQLDIPVIYIHRESGRIHGAQPSDVRRILGAADLLLNVGGVCWLPDFRLCERRALVDMDPLFTQVKHFAAEVLDDYHIHFSYGTNIGSADCRIPTRGVVWHPLLPPVVLDLWPLAPPPPPGAPFTTIANWGAYGGLEHEGEWYGQKDVEFLRVVNVPQEVPCPLELALSGADVQVHDQFRAAGWSVRDAGEEVSIDIPTYCRYIADSRGEFSVAKHAYIHSRSGWVSDRTACYLASGRPVVLQDTAASRRLPAADGLRWFNTPGEAVAALRDVAARYEDHARAARQLARRHFDHRVVLPGLLETAMGGTVAAASKESASPSEGGGAA